MARDENMITSIEVDRDQILHLTILGQNGSDKVIADKNNFVYNLLQNDIWGTNAIWCKVNGENYWISKNNLQINNQQIHHLL